MFRPHEAPKEHIKRFPLGEIKLPWMRVPEVPEGFQRMKMPPIRAVCAGGRHDHKSYFFLPWFLTASIAAAAASGSR